MNTRSRFYYICKKFLKHNLDDEETTPMGNLQDDLALSGDEDVDDDDQDLGMPTAVFLLVAEPCVSFILSCHNLFRT